MIPMRSFRISEKVSIDKDWHQGRYLEIQENSELESEVDQIEHEDIKEYQSVENLTTKLIQIRYKSTHWSRKPINCSNGYEERTSRCSPLHWLSSGIYDGNRKIALEQGNFINWSILRFTCTSTQNLAINKSMAPSLLQIGEDQLQFSTCTKKLKFNQLIKVCVVDFRQRRTSIKLVVEFSPSWWRMM